MGFRKDIWRPAIVQSSFDGILERGSLEGLPFQWLPDPGPFRFLADPFALWRGDLLHVFVETYDYRVRVGSVDVLTYDKSLTLLDQRSVLCEPWHLSYPLVFEADGQTWMLPEAHKSGGLMLYRARDFPYHWERAHEIELGHIPVDATPVHHDGYWWLFYTVANSEWDKMGSLHCSFADCLQGPWRHHPSNPISRGLASARPGGAAVVRDSQIVLPVQDCRKTYGGALQILRLRVTPSTIDIKRGPRLEAISNFAPYTEGLHTLSSAGHVALVDAKQTQLSLKGLSIEVGREIKKIGKF